MHISEDYRQQQSALHDTGAYGTQAVHYADLAASIINKLQIEHLLDYGCGKKLGLAQGLRGKVKHAFRYQAYDPAVPEFATAPVPAQMVACLDVLEHVEEEHIDAVLDHLESLTEEVALVSITTGPAKKTLPDGRNAHILQRPPVWWLPRLMARFDLRTFQVTGEEQFYVILSAPPRHAEALDGNTLT